MPKCSPDSIKAKTLKVLFEPDLAKSCNALIPCSSLSFFDNEVISTSSSSAEIYLTSPAVGSTSLSIAFPKVVFPHPLSPARPKTSPLKISKSTPSTANT